MDETLNSGLPRLRPVKWTAWSGSEWIPGKCQCSGRMQGRLRGRYIRYVRLLAAVCAQTNETLNSVRLESLCANGGKKADISYNGHGDALASYHCTDIFLEFIQILIRLFILQDANEGDLCSVSHFLPCQLAADLSIESCCLRYFIRTL